MVLGRPPKLTKPQRGRRDCNIGTGRQYADEAAFQAALEGYNAEKIARDSLMKERERLQKQQRNARRDPGRDRSGRQRDGPDETDSERRVRQRRGVSNRIARIARTARIASCDISNARTRINHNIARITSLESHSQNRTARIARITQITSCDIPNAI